MYWAGEPYEDEEETSAYRRECFFTVERVGAKQFVVKEQK
jgi:hypothetical protein